MPSDRLRINEIFHSIQGEGSHVGRPCVFVRLTGCHLRCGYCDTEYAFYEGAWMELDEILAAVEGYACELVEVTGGEPLLQPGVYPLMGRLLDAGKTVLLETSGCIDASRVDRRVIKIMDLKCPSSGEAEKNVFENVEFLAPVDEVKFVIGDRKDYDWSRAVMERYGLTERCGVLFSPVFGAIEPARLAEWVLADGLNVRLQVQMHKYIWDPNARGV